MGVGGFGSRRGSEWGWGDLVVGEAPNGRGIRLHN